MGSEPAKLVQLFEALRSALLEKGGALPREPSAAEVTRAEKWARGHCANATSAGERARVLLFLLEERRARLLELADAHEAGEKAGG